MSNRLCLGGGHGHSHGGPPKGHHSRHGTHSHLAALADEEEEDQDSCYQQDVVDGRQPKESAPGKEQKPAPGAASQMNMRGVFLHVMADALGSVVVIVSAIIIWQTEWEYKYYVDPGKHHLSWLKIVKKFT